MKNQDIGLQDKKMREIIGKESSDISSTAKKEEEKNMNPDMDLNFK
jgi:hypothetical protein